MRGSLALLAGVVLAGGCRSLLGIEEATVGDAGVTPDIPVDAGFCYGSAPFTICLDAEPTGIRVFVDEQLDTDGACPLVYPHGNQTWCVHAASSIQVGGTLRATGSRPLVLLAAVTLEVASTGTVDVSSKLTTIGATAFAAGSRLGPCAATTPGSASITGAGGGAGGSFGTKGGNGGNGDGGDVAGSPAGLAVTSPHDELRGGCAGSKGGTTGTAGTCTAGDGGGAVYLIAGTNLEVDGTINASGAGAAGGQFVRAGGCGAGSGGMIVLSSRLISSRFSAQIYANGGGGGGAASATTSGGPGMDSPGPTVKALGGNPGTGGIGAGTGGTGSLGASPGEKGVDDAGGAGGGGGGGGAGVLRVFGSVLPASANISPPPSS